MNYTSSSKWKEYFGNDAEVPNPYKRYERIAVAQLTNYAIRFPNVEEFKAMEEINKQSYEYIKDAILEQIKYMYDNPQYFEEIGGSTSYTMGRISVSGTQMTSAELDQAKFSKIAIEYLELSGIVVHSLCNPYINHCSPCGCNGVMF